MIDFGLCGRCVSCQSPTGARQRGALMFGELRHRQPTQMRCLHLQGAAAQRRTKRFHRGAAPDAVQERLQSVARPGAVAPRQLRSWHRRAADVGGWPPSKASRGSHVATPPPANGGVRNPAACTKTAVWPCQASTGIDWFEPPRVRRQAYPLRPPQRWRLVAHGSRGRRASSEAASLRKRGRSLPLQRRQACLLAERTSAGREHGSLAAVLLRALRDPLDGEQRAGLRRLAPQDGDSRRARRSRRRCVHGRSPGPRHRRKGCSRSAGLDPPRCPTGRCSFHPFHPSSFT